MRMLFSALLTPFRGGVKGKIAELPDVEAKSTGFHGVLANLQIQVRQRARGLKPVRNCSGQPVSPTPKIEAEGEIVVPLEADVPDKRD